MEHAQLTSREVIAIARAVGIDVKQENTAPIADMLAAIQSSVAKQVGVLDQDGHISLCFDARVHGAA